nr:hypothetical protein [Tanacetum cinerariifolium]
MTIAEEEPSVGKNDARAEDQRKTFSTSSTLLIKSCPHGDEISELKKALRNRPQAKSLWTNCSLRKKFSKAAESSFETTPEITSDSESECDIEEPLSLLPKLLRVEPNDTSKDDISLADLTLTLAVSDEIKKKADSSTKKLLLTLMEEVKGLKEQIKIPLDTSLSVPQSGSSKSAKGKQKTWFGSCKHYRKTLVSMTITLMSVSTTLDVTSVVALLMKPLTVLRNLSQTKGNQELLVSDPMNPLKSRFIKETNLFQNVCVGLLKEACMGEALNIACYTKKIIIVKIHGKTSYDVLRGRSPDISYFHVFGRHVHIYNHMDHLRKFDAKVDDVFFLGYSLVAKEFRVSNIKRQEIKETYHVTFSEDDEAISKSGTKGDEINFNANKSFPDDEFIVPRNNVFQCYGNDSYFPYILAYDPLSTNNITIPDPITPSEPIIISSETPEFTAVDDHLILNEHNDSELVKYLRVAKYQVFIIRNSTSRGCQILYGKLVCWSAKKQSSVAMSSVEAEYVVAAECCAQVL